MSEENDSRIQVEITDFFFRWLLNTRSENTAQTPWTSDINAAGFSEPHCFRLVFNPLTGERIEIMLHARSLVDLIHQSSAALCEWQHHTTAYLIDRIRSAAQEE